MALESGTYLADLVVTNPPGTDPKAQGDDHIRLLKNAAKNSFAGFAGMVIVTGSEAQGATVNDYVVTVSPAPAAYTASALIVFKAAHANTGAATVTINALAAKTLKAVDGSALESGDIESGAVVGAYYDGTDFFLITGNDRAARAGDTYTGTHDFTGVTAIQVPTQTPGNNTTKAASTAYVDAADALKADLASPALTGTPTAPTAAAGTNTTQVATTAFATQLAFQAALPAQTSNSGKFLTTDGASASWANLLDLAASKSADYTVISSDRYAAFDLTGTHTLSLTAAATLGNGFRCFVRNAGTGVWTIDPNASETVTTDDGTARTTTKLYSGESGTLLCDGAGWRILGRGHGPLLITTTTVSGSPTAVAMETGFTDAEIVRFRFAGVGVTASAASNQPDIRVKSGGSYGSALSTIGGTNIAGPVTFAVDVLFPASTGSMLDIVATLTPSAPQVAGGAVLQGVELTWGGTTLSAGTLTLYGYR